MKKTINESDLKPEGADIPLGITRLLFHLLKLHCLGAYIAQFCTIFKLSSIAQSFWGHISHNFEIWKICRKTKVKKRYFGLES